MEVVISDGTDRQAMKWGQQFVRANPKRRVNLNLNSARHAGKIYEKAAGLARNNDVIIVSVGHGGADHTDGSFLLDLAPKASARLVPDIMDDARLRKTESMFKRARKLGNRQCRDLLNRAKPLWNPREGVTPKPMANDDMEDALACARLKNDAEHDRVKLRALYSRIGSALRQYRVGFVVLLTCNIGNSHAFVQRLANDWGVSILAFKDQIALWPDGSGNVRIYMESDAVGTGTNTERARTELPVLLDQLTPTVPSREFDEPTSDEQYMFDSGDRYLICSGRSAGSGLLV